MTDPEAPHPSAPHTQLDPADPVAVMNLVNERFMAEWPSPGAEIGVKKREPSNTWTRAVYIEGLLALQDITGDQRLQDYALSWGESHAWGLHGGQSTRLADDQCAGQAYLELHARAPNVARIDAVAANVDAMVSSAAVDDWTWIDAIQMAMPVFARLGVLTNSPQTLEKMNALYTYTRDAAGGVGLYDRGQHLWFRDATFLPPHAAPNGEGCFWSRGNGWVYAGLARVLTFLPPGTPHRSEYQSDFVAMSEALLRARRADGFWNPSLRDPTQFGGKELTGTSLIVYGMAWGVRHGLLSRALYEPAVRASWRAMVKDAVHADGVLGFVQGTATGPSDGQPVAYDERPNYDDFGVGCFLLAGSEIMNLQAGSSQTSPGPDTVGR